MIEVATASINSFARKEQSVVFSVQPSDQLITLTLGQLQDLIQETIERATAPLQARLDALVERGAGSGVGERTPQDAQEDLNQIFQVIQDLKASLESLEDMTARERAYDRQRLARLERVDPQPLQKDRGEILRALIAANGGKMLAKEARQKMRLSKQTFSMLLASMSEYIETKPLHSDKRKDVLMLK